MRWPRVIRKLHSEPAPDLSRRSTVDSSAQDLSNGDGDSTSKSAPPDDPSLSQMFTDAALYDRVLNAGPESLKKGFPFNADDQAIPNCLGGFNDLIGRDLGDVERAVTDRLAKLSVHNWAARIDDPFGPDTPPDAEQGERSPSEDGEDEKQTPLSIPPTLEEEPPSEPKLTPEEIIDLLEQEFGALAPPGEEKLLLETDAAFFKDVVVLVGSSPFTYSVVGSIFFFPAIFRASFTSPRIDLPFTLHSYPPNRVNLKMLSGLVRPWFIARDGVGRVGSGCNWITI